MQTIYFFLAAFFAEIIALIAGFGAATLLTPIAAFFYDIKQVVLLVAIFHIFAEGFPAILFLKYVNWKVVALFGIPSLFATIIGAQLIMVLPKDTIVHILGWFLVLWATISFFNFPFWIPKSSATLLGGGLLSGFIAGLIGTGGAIRSMALTSFGLLRENYLGTSALIAVMVDILRLPFYLKAGIRIDSPFLVFGLIVIAFFGALIGRKIAFKISKAAFRKIVLIAIFLAGLKFILE